VLHFGDKAAAGSKKNFSQGNIVAEICAKRTFPIHRKALLEAEPGDRKVATVNCNLR
jgi:hypothetical protein